ncbi:unknow [Vibrio campbellii]|nr:unknow [Vibrio campbellii]
MLDVVVLKDERFRLGMGYRDINFSDITYESAGLLTVDFLAKVA